MGRLNRIALDFKLELKQIHLKALTCQGSDDRFVSVKGTKYGQNQMLNFLLKKYEGAYHGRGPDGDISDGDNQMVI